VSAALGIAGCTIPYQKMGGLLSAHGYEDLKLGDDTYRITYKGAARADQESVDLYALYRCAELTLEQGYEYFVIADKSDMADVSTDVENQVSSHKTGGFGSDSYGSTTTESKTTVETKTKHTVVRTIRMYKGAKPEGTALVYNARELKENLETTINR
jgi:hypothetical protein